MERNITYPKDAIVIVQYLSGLTGGRTINVTGFVGEVVEAGSVIVDDGGTLKVLSSAIANSTQASGDNTVQVEKGHGLKVGDSVLAATITAIDTSNADYDTVTCSGTFGAAITAGDSIVNAGNTSVGVVVTSKVVKEDDTVDVGVLTRGIVNEAVMTAPIDADVKTALPLIEFRTE